MGVAGEQQREHRRERRYVVLQTEQVQRERCEGRLGTGRGRIAEGLKASPRTLEFAPQTNGCQRDAP